MVATWLSALDNAKDDDSDDDDAVEEEGNSREDNDNTSENDEEGDDPPETQDPNMQPLPEENEKKYPQENDKYFIQQVLCAKGQVSIAPFHGPWEHNKHRYRGEPRHFLS
jgi:hypothetical protein